MKSAVNYARTGTAHADLAWARPDQYAVLMKHAVDAWSAAIARGFICC